MGRSEAPTLGAEERPPSLEPPPPRRTSSAEHGDVIAGRFFVEECVGEGGFAFVYRSTNLELGEPVAIKLLKPAFASDPDVRVRFAREARAAATLKSEYVCQVSDVGTHDGHPFLVMEYLRGRDLESFLADGALPIVDAVDIVLQACAGVAAAHAAGIIHRDIKPENLFVVDDLGWRHVKVLDFGISKLTLEGRLSNVDMESSETTGALGTPYYMSPEQLRSARTVDHRTDVWSLGAVLFELVTGETPFGGTSEFTELVAQILERPHPSARALRPDTPQELADVIDRCLRKDREERLESAGALALALMPFASPSGRRAAEQAASLARVDGRAPDPPDAAVIGAPDPSETAGGAPAPRAPRRGALRYAALGLALVFAAALAGRAVRGRGAQPALAPAEAPATRAGATGASTLAALPVVVRPHATATPVKKTAPAVTAPPSASRGARGDAPSALEIRRLR